MDIRHIQEELYPRIFREAKFVFPELQLRRTAKGYVATDGRSFDGTQGKAEGKINYLETSPAVMFDNRAGITRNVIKYIQDREQLPSYWDAVKFCARKVDFTISEETFSENNPEHHATLEFEYQKRQAFEEVQRLFVVHLWQNKPQNKENQALRYLHQRGYSDDDIRAMNLGFALPFSEVQKHLRPLGFSEEVLLSLGLQSAVPDKHEAAHWHKIGETYTITFPVRDAVGRMQGFIVRADEVLRDDEGKERYPKYVFTKNLSKAVPVGFNHTLAQSHIVAVEGIADALFLQARGFRNVIAVGGKHITEEQLQTLERYGVRSITLAFDNDEEGKRGTLQTIEKLRKFAYFSKKQHNEWNIYVCKPTAFGAAKDPDEFVRTFGNEAFVRVVEQEIEAAEIVIARSIAEEYGVSADAEYSPKQRDTALQRAWNYVQYLRSPLHEHTFIQEFSRRSGIAAEVLQKTSTFATEFFRQEHRTAHLQELLAQAQDKLRRGEEPTHIENFLTREISTHANASSLPRIYTLQTFLEEISTTPDGLATGYPELDDTIKLSQNGVTIIAARPSHGKTAFKMNLLLRLIEAYPERTFCFFSFEEPVKIITLKLLNILAGVRFQGQQMTDLLQYLRQSHTSPLSNNGTQNNSFYTQKYTIQAVEEAKKKLGLYLESGRLVLSGERVNPEIIRSTLHHLHERTRLGGVFVDYVQKVKPASGKFATRQLELQEVSSSLHGIAVDLRVPMIVGAQFNREVRSESDVREDCLREAGDLEQDANLVLALWNPAKGDNDETLVQSQLGSVDVRRVELKVKTLKNRDGATNTNGVSLLYDMPLSTIRSMRT